MGTTRGTDDSSLGDQGASQMHVRRDPAIVLRPVLGAAAFGTTQRVVPDDGGVAEGGVRAAGVPAGATSGHSHSSMGECSMLRRATGALIALAVSGGLLSVAAPAPADDTPVVIDTGSCKAESRYKLRVAIYDETRILVTGKVVSDSDHLWTWKLKHNGDRSARGRATAKGKHSRFKVKRTMVNIEGPDQVVFRAKNRGNGEVCRAKVSY